MAKFEFRNKKAELEFPTFSATVGVNEGTQNYIIKSGEEIESKAAEINSNPQILIDLITKYIDDLCGEGTTEKIMAGEVRDIYDYMEVYHYIITEIRMYYKTVRQKFTLPEVK